MYKDLYVIGCGGVGSALVPFLCRWNNHTKTYSSITLIDGDKVEDKNLERQNFSENGVGEFKSEVLKSRCKEDGIAETYRLEVVTEYINEKVLAKLVNERNINHFVIAVDNSKTKAEINNLHNKLSDSVIIMPANGYDTFDCHIAIRKNGVNITPDITYMQPDIETPKDKSPLEMSCEEAAESFPQLIFANMGAATWGALTIYALNNDKDFKPFRALYGHAGSVSFRRAEYPDDVLVHVDN